MDRTERIRTMETTLREAEAAAAKLQEALDQYADLWPRVVKLYAYYGSKTWFADRRADEKGKLPADLPRGVLGEDEVYDLMGENREILGSMLALSADMVWER